MTVEIRQHTPGKDVDAFNAPVNVLIKSVKGQIYKRYRVYEKPLPP